MEETFTQKNIKKATQYNIYVLSVTSQSKNSG